MRKLLLTMIAFVIIGSSSTPLSAATVLPASSTSSEPDPATVKAAIEAFNNLPRAERREKMKELRKELKAFKTAKKAGNEPSTNTILLVILAILLPPLAVYLHEGHTNKRFWISVLLTLLFWVPGVIYALVVVLGD